jgi:Zn finger protein HypA/HybF involved in hydrogenase expression
MKGKTMPIEMVCKQCGQAFTPSRQEIMAGPAVYRYCPKCRPPADGDQLERPPIAARR